MDLFINTPEANLRVTPDTSKAPLAVLPVGHLITATGSVDGVSNDWQPCRTLIDGHNLDGFVHTSLLRVSINGEVDRLIEAVGNEYKEFRFGTRNETHPDSKPRIDTYWTALGLQPQPVSEPWSAAFISFVVREAALTKSFRFSGRHARYFSDSKIAFQNQNATHAYWAVRLNNRVLEMGDLVGYFRTGRETCGSQAHTYDDLPGDFCGHSDVVVAIQNGIAFTIGGNVSQTVRVKEVPLMSTGKVAKGNKRILVMKRNF